MDFATVLGLLVGVIVVSLAVATDASLTIFLNLPGFMIVIGGTFAATLIKFPISTCVSALVEGSKAVFVDRKEDSARLVAQANELAALSRKDGLLSLEKQPIRNAFMRKGIRMCVDDNPPEFIHKVLTTEIIQSIHRAEMSERISRTIGESAPAFGLIGTLVGLVQMLSHLSDPASIGPAMAVALLTTLYGALIASLIAIPMADKLKTKALQARNNCALIIDSVLSIQKGENPRIMRELLDVYIADNRRKNRVERRKKASDPLVGIYVKSERRSSHVDRRRDAVFSTE